MTRKEIQSELCSIRSRLEDLEFEARALWETSESDDDGNLAQAISDLAGLVAELEDDD